MFLLASFCLLLFLTAHRSFADVLAAMSRKRFTKLDDRAAMSYQQNLNGSPLPSLKKRTKPNVVMKYEERGAGGGVYP